jgi:hypothetical protein
LALTSAERAPSPDEFVALTEYLYEVPAVGVLSEYDVEDTNEVVSSVADPFCAVAR